MTNFYKQNQRISPIKQTSSLNKRGKLNSANTLNKRRKSNNPNDINNTSEIKDTTEPNIKAIVGNWIVAVGTLLSAIGNTPSTIFTQQTLNDFNVIGHILEAGGIAIVSETEDTLLYTVGDQLQAIGNLTVVVGILSENEQTAQLLEKQGNLIQVVGLGLVINTEGKLTLLQTLYNTGIIIQLIGNAIEAIANTETNEGKLMRAVGAWIKAIGAFITALATE